MAAIKKTDFSAIKKKYSKEATYKADRFFDLGDAFLDATGIPGPGLSILLSPVTATVIFRLVMDIN